MSQNPSGKLYLIPTLLGEDVVVDDVLPKKVKDIADHIRFYIVENEKSARHFLKKIGIKIPLPELILFPLDKHNPAYQDYKEMLAPVFKGENVGVLSEAGCPAIADPGAEVVRYAHTKGIQVVPLVGPSSILLALMASGLNGQSFVFHGYLPREKADKVKKLKEIDLESQRKKQTQIFIEAPYRNTQLLEDILACCENKTRLTIAVDISLETEFIHTKTIGEWKKQKPEINKRPCVFLLLNA